MGADLRIVFVVAAWIVLGIAPTLASAAPSSPTPLEADGRPVDWVFVFKLNAGVFPSDPGDAGRTCGFGGTPKDYKFSQVHAVASSLQPTLREGQGLAGSGGTDALSSRYAAIYNGKLHYVVWNDQFYGRPPIRGCTDSCSAPWGHSKGVVAWNDTGEGILLQVTTPSWPAAASAEHPRGDDGNTLGCVEDDNVKVSQDFFALRLTEEDVEKVLDGIANASVVTDPGNIQLVANGGPASIVDKVARLGTRSDSTAWLNVMLSTGVRLVSKPSGLHVPPWQFVSATLGGVDLRVASWWADPQIPSAPRGAPACWDARLAAPGAVAIATSGKWAGRPIGLRGGPFPDANHAKVGVSVSGRANYTIFGDMNQQGALAGNCASSQNGRGGLFLVVDNAALNESVAALIEGETAPTAGTAAFAATDVAAPAIPETPIETKSTSIDDQAGVSSVTAFSLNCRARASGKSEVVAVLVDGDKVHPTRRVRSWALVTANGASCWVARKFLSGDAL